jgi:hypothetical protein
VALALAPPLRSTVHNLVDPARITTMCVLIFVSCAGLGAAAFWATTRTDEPVTLREVRMVVRALFAAALAAWMLLIVTPQNLVWPVIVFFTVFAGLVVILLAVTHRRIDKRKEEELPYE